MDGRYISVVIPAFNASQVISDAVNSALSQPEVGEVIVVDDGSTDDTHAVVQTIESSKVTLIRQENAGASRARNIGAAHAKCPYIAFLDADDCFMPRRFKRQFFGMLHHEMELSISSIIVSSFEMERMYVFSKSKFANLSRSNKRLAIFSQYLIMNTPTIIVKKELFDAIGGFDDRLKLREDHKFIIDALALGDVFIEDSSPVVRRMYSKSTTSGIAVERILAGHFAFLNHTSHSSIERLAANLSLFHVVFRRFGLLSAISSVPYSLSLVLFYPLYIFFKVIFK